MTTLLTRPDLITGDPYVKSFIVNVDNAPIAASTVVKAALKGFNEQLIFAIVICSVVNNTWTANFSGTQTAALLQTPTDLTSKLNKTITTNLDSDTGYGQVKLEIQIGSPYNLTWTANLTVGKGLIA